MFAFFDFDGVSWTETATLTSPTIADFRQLGDTVNFVNDDTPLVRENNFLNPAGAGLKGQLQIYNLGD